MEPGRFDDVDIRFVEDPEPPREGPSLRRRMTIALTAWIVAAGVVAAGASALASKESSQTAARKAAAARTAEGVPFKRSSHECRRGRDHDGSRSSSTFSPSDF